MLDSQTVHVVSGGDARIAEQLCAMMTSVVGSLDPNFGVVFHLLDCGVQTPTEQFLRRWPAKLRNRAELRWLRVCPSYVAGLPDTSNLPKETFLRLSIADLLDANLERALWMDTDTIAVSSVHELYAEPMSSEFVIAAVPEFSAHNIGSAAWTAATCQIVGVDPLLPYFNGGVMTIDLKKWRSLDISSSVLSYTRRFLKSIVFGDQDGLNIVLAGRWKRVDLRWNAQSGSLRTMSRLPPNRFLPEAMERRHELLHAPWIVHFAGDKPWVSGVANPLRHHFFRAVRESQIYPSYGYLRRRTQILVNASWYFLTNRLRGR